jgi:hypothetical protein
VPKQKITATEKQKEIEALAPNPKEEASQIQKLSAQVEMSRPAPQAADNSQGAATMAEQYLSGVRGLPFGRLRAS